MATGQRRWVAQLLFERKGGSNGKRREIDGKN
jgi:hypothetical protein